MASCGDDMRHRLWELHGDCGGDDPALFAEDGQGYYAGTAEMTPLHYRSVSGLTQENLMAQNFLNWHLSKAIEV